jgi:hypothetical protein
MSTASSTGPASTADRDGRSARVPYRQRRRDRADAHGSVIGAGRSLLVRVVRLVVSVVVLIIVAGILLVVLKANPTNSVVSDVHDWARSLTGPFDGMFSFHNAHTAIAVNWGIAAVVYLVVAGLITRLIGRSRR